MSNKLNQLNNINNLIAKLTEASTAYYLYDKPIMTDKQYDDLMDQLEKLEAETGIIMANSPTQRVQGSVLEYLPKVEHDRPMLSSDKTKDVNKIKNFVHGEPSMCSYKMDGLTLVTRYHNGKLIQAVTRGNGHIGEDVTEQAKMISNIPLTIPCNYDLLLRGECVMSWETFNNINESLETPYSHPRNLAAGSLRTLDTNITRERNLKYIVFEIVSIDKEKPYRFFNYRNDSLDYLDELGFTTVPRWPMINSDDEVDAAIDKMTADNIKYPVDGLIFNYEVLSYAAGLGTTSKFPLDMIALKWENETFETTLVDIEWNTTRTGRINPTAIFEPVIIEGSTVSRATVHNVSIMEELALGKGDTITVYKSNQIIPAIDENLTMSGTFAPPNVCPVCGSATEIHNDNGSKTLHCTNPRCKARLLSSLSHFVSRDCMNIDGLSEAKLSRFIELGWLRRFSDIYDLHNHKDEMCKLNGFGKSSVQNLLNAIAKSKCTDLAHFLNALGIPGCGTSISKDIARYCNYDINYFREIMDGESGASEFAKIEGIGAALVGAMNLWYTSEGATLISDLLLDGICFEDNYKAKQSVNTDLDGCVYVITGNLKYFENREQLKELIESLGGKVGSSVTEKTTSLINNDINSTSGKNKKANELGIPVITEDMFLKNIGIAKEIV